MATTVKAISAAMKLIDVKKENLRKAFEEVESHSSSLTSFTLTWSQIDSHFTSLQSSLQHKFQFLQTLEEQQQQEKEKTPNLVVVRTARTQLKSLCQNMNGLGLRQFVIQRPKERDTIRLELQDAFASAPDPGALVLDAMEESFSSSNDVDLRRTCVMFLEELMKITIQIKGEVRERAMILAIDCKEMLGSVTNNKNTFGILGFLLLVAVYGLRNAFTVHDLIDYVVAVAKNKIAVQLCSLLNFGDQISGLIEKLIHNGNQILAVKFIFEFEMSGKFPPVPLLEDYAMESKSLFKKTRKRGHLNAQTVNEATMKELDILKSVVKCVEDYKLASEFPKLHVLLDRIKKLEREKSNRKRSGPAPASVLPEKQPKLQKNSIVNHFQTTEPADPATVTERNTLLEKQSILQKETKINHLRTAEPASVTTRDTANLTIPENVAASSALPSYQQPHDPYAAAPIGPYGLAGSNPDVDPYAVAPVGPYAMSGPNPDIASYTAGSSSNMYEVSQAYTSINGNPPNLYPSGSQIPSETFGMAGPTYAGQYEQSGAPMGFNGNIPATSSSLYPPGSQMPSGYYDGNTAYGGYGWPPEYHPSYYPQ